MCFGFLHRLLSGKTNADENPRGTNSRLGTPNSTSTYTYSHEPFATFQNKVERLAKNLYHVDSVVVKQMRGGSYNRVVGVTIKVGAQDIQGVFRIPRRPSMTSLASTTAKSLPNKRHRPGVNRSILNGASFLRYIGQQPNLAIPSLLAFDATAENEISSPYMFQQLAVGVSLVDVYDSMTPVQRLGIADELSAFLAQMESVTFPKIGTLRAPQDQDIITSMVSTNGLDHGPAPEIRGFMITRLSKDFESEPYETLSDLLHKQIRHWASCENESDWDDLKQMWNRLSQIMEEMRLLNYFSSGDPSQSKNVLFHWDLEPRNILVRQIDPSAGEMGSWKIDKVIDWDDCLVLPNILTRKPPVWLWHFVDDLDEHDPIETGYDGDVDLLPPQEYPPQLDSDNLKLRSHFEEHFRQRLATVGTSLTAEEYHDQAYGKGRWIRRLARFAIHGVYGDQDLNRFKKFDKEWSDVEKHTGS